MMVELGALEVGPSEVGAFVVGGTSVATPTEVEG
jgi:hypothetical protein